jgi:hypothetical protein
MTDAQLATIDTLRDSGFVDTFSALKRDGRWEIRGHYPEPVTSLSSRQYFITILPDGSYRVTYKAG